MWWIFEVDAVFWDELGDCCFGLCFEGVLANEENRDLGLTTFRIYCYSQVLTIDPYWMKQDGSFW